MDVPGTNADIVVLAGDICEGASGLEWAAGFRQDVVYVPGNHEFYGYDMDAWQRQMTYKEASHPNIHVLQNKVWFHEVEGIRRVRFIGTTLWTDFDLYTNGDEKERMWSMIDCIQGVPDFSCIYTQNRTIRPADMRQWHLQSRAWLESMLAIPFDGPTVVVTHHAPDKGSLAPVYAKNVLSPAYVSDLTGITMSPHAPDLWIHGHTHSKFHYHRGRTTFLCNPRGFSGEVYNFDPEFIFELKI